MGARLSPSRALAGPRLQPGWGTCPPRSWPECGRRSSAKPHPDVNQGGESRRVPRGCRGSRQSFSCSRKARAGPTVPRGTRLGPGQQVSCFLAKTISQGNKAQLIKGDLSPGHAGAPAVAREASILRRPGQSGKWTAGHGQPRHRPPPRDAPRVSAYSMLGSRVIAARWRKQQRVVLGSPGSGFLSLLWVLPAPL